MQVVLTRGGGALAAAVVPRLLACGHDVRVPVPPEGTAERRALPVGVRAADPTSADAVLVLGTDLGALARFAVPGARVVVATDRDVEATEARLVASGAEWTLQVTTVLHEDLDRALRAAGAVPHARSVQPIAADEVADRLTRLLRAAPAGRVPDAGGPRRRALGDLAPHLPDGPAPADWPVEWFVPRRVAAQVDFDDWRHRSARTDGVEEAHEPAGSERSGRPSGAVERV
jgi:hypothetical protein